MRSSLHILWRRIRALLTRSPSPSPAAVDAATIETLTQVPPRNLALYQQALTHRSLLRTERDSHLASNERLEFLGDAILGALVARHLYDAFPDKDEGFLTRLRAKLVRGRALADFGRSIGLGDALLLSDNMAQGGGRNNPTILADAFEALIGALYLDHGEEAVRSFVHRVVLRNADLQQLAVRNDNHKSQLLEFAQAQGWDQPAYRVVREEGPSHAKTFTVEVLVRDDAYGEGTAGSKKKAEQQAAREALQRLQKEEPTPS